MICNILRLNNTSKLGKDYGKYSSCMKVDCSDNLKKYKKNTPPEEGVFDILIFAIYSVSKAGKPEFPAILPHFLSEEVNLQKNFTLSPLLNSPPYFL